MTWVVMLVGLVALAALLVLAAWVGHGLRAAAVLINVYRELQQLQQLMRCDPLCTLPDDDCALCERFQCEGCGMIVPWSDGGCGGDLDPDDVLCAKCWCKELDRAPADDEVESPEDRAAVAEGRQGIAAGDALTTADVRAENGLVDQLRKARDEVNAKPNHERVPTLRESGVFPVTTARIKAALDNGAYIRGVADGSIPGEPIPDYGEHITVAEFERRCHDGSLCDYDGNGEWALADSMLPLLEPVYPSQVCAARYERPSGATHVVWFNK